MTTANSADKMQGLVLVRTAFVWIYMKGAYSLARNLVYITLIFIANVCLSLAGCFSFPRGGGGGVIGGIFWVCNKTQL